MFMYYGAPLDLGHPMPGPPMASPPPAYTGPTRAAGSRCHTSLLLEFPVFLYGLIHLLAATFGIIILQVITTTNTFQPCNIRIIAESESHLSFKV